MRGVFTDLETSDYRCTVLAHDMDLYGWTVTWEFACYITDRIIAQEFGPVPTQEQLCPPLPCHTAGCPHDAGYHVEGHLHVYCATHAYALQQHAHTNGAGLVTLTPYH